MVPPAKAKAGAWGDFSAARINNQGSEVSVGSISQGTPGSYCPTQGKVMGNYPQTSMVMRISLAGIAAMVMLEVFRGGFPHLPDREGYIQFHPRQRMVEIDNHLFKLHFSNNKMDGVIFFIHGLINQARLQLHLGVKIGPGHFHNQVLINLSESLLRGQMDT